jgi:hypothetical protein
MQTMTTTTRAAYRPTGTLNLNTAAASRRRSLTAARHGGTVWRDASIVAPRPLPDPRAVARAAVADPRSTHDRVLDRVADGLMATLGW